MTVHSANPTNSGKIIYVYDPLCGWCYGFSPVMQKLYAQYNGTLQFEVLSGGMITGERVQPIKTMASFIRKAYKEVERGTGVKFGKRFTGKILDEGTAIFSSVPPSQALMAFKQLNPAKALTFAHDIQQAIYGEGIEPTNISHYGMLAQRLGVDSTKFMTLMKTDAIKRSTEKEFSDVQEMGVEGFPAVFYVDPQGKRTMISNGYVSLAELEAKLKSVINTK
jgi:putative protein-disulfide isomerase